MPATEQTVLSQFPRQAALPADASGRRGRADRWALRRIRWQQVRYPQLRVRLLAVALCADEPRTDLPRLAGTLQGRDRAFSVGSRQAPALVRLRTEFSTRSISISARRRGLAGPARRRF